MSEWLNIPADLIYLPLAEEALPLLKRGVIPLQLPAASGLPWFGTAVHNALPATVRVPDDVYQEHLQQEYRRLPGTLRGLLTLEAFVLQAEKKRPVIEAALLNKQQVQTQQAVGDPADWLMQRFFTDPYSLLSWQHGGGLKRLWLGIDARQWPEAQPQRVEYRLRQPDAYPQRLLSDSPAMEALKEWRLVRAVKLSEPLVDIAGQQQGLLRLPPKALRCVLAGATVNDAFLQRFKTFWWQDFRYQRIPLAQMTLTPDEYGWQFRVVQRPA